MEFTITIKRDWNEIMYYSCEALTCKWGKKVLSNEIRRFINDVIASLCRAYDELRKFQGVNSASTFSSSFSIFYGIFQEHDASKFRSKLKQSWQRVLRNYVQIWPLFHVKKMWQKIEHFCPKFVKMVKLYKILDWNIKFFVQFFVIFFYIGYTMFFF